MDLVFWRDFSILTLGSCHRSALRNTYCKKPTTTTLLGYRIVPCVPISVEDAQKASAGISQGRSPERATVVRAAVGAEVESVCSWSDV